MRTEAWRGPDQGYRLINIGFLRVIGIIGPVYRLLRVKKVLTES